MWDVERMGSETGLILSPDDQGAMGRSKQRPSCCRLLGILNTVFWNSAIGTCCSVVLSLGFAALRQLRNIRHLVSATIFQSLVAALVLSRLDYCNGTLVDPPTYLIRRLQFGSECSVTAHIPAPSFRAHNRRACLSSLVTSAGKDRFQGRRAALSNIACWIADAVCTFGSHAQRWRPVSTKRLWSSSTTDIICLFMPSGFLYGWTSHLPCRLCMYMDRFTFGHYLLAVFACI